MKRIIALTKIFFKNGNSLFNIDKSKKQKTGNYILPIILIALIFLMFSFFISFYSSFSIANLDNLGNITSEIDHNFLNNLLIILFPYTFSYLFVFLATIVTSTFFLSTDSDTFLHMPIKAGEIFVAKFLSCLIYAYIIEVVLILPLDVAYSIVSKAGILSIFNQLLIFVALPIIPILVVYAVDSLVSKIFNLKKHRSWTVSVLLIFTLFIVLGVQSISGTFMPSDMNAIDEEFILKIKEASSIYVNNMGILKYILGFITNGYHDNSILGLLSSLGFISFCMILLLITFAISNKHYHKNLLDENESLKSGKKKQNSIFKFDSQNNAYLKKEFKILFRSPEIVIQTVFPPIILLLVIVSTFITLYNSDPSVTSDVNYFMDLFKNTFKNNTVIIPFASVCLSTICCSMILISATSFSREGNGINLLKLIPISLSRQIKLKMIPGILASIVISSITIVFCGILIEVTWYYILLAILISVLTSISLNYFMIMTDLKHPYLDWSSEIAAIKQNKTTMFTMLILFAIAFINILICFIMINSKISIVISSIITILINLGIIISYELKLKNKRHSLIEYLE